MALSSKLPVPSLSLLNAIPGTQMLHRTQFLFALVTLFLTGHQIMAEDLKVGSAAPEFSLQGTDGKTYKLSQFKGKQFVVVAWYPKALTGG